MHKILRAIGAACVTTALATAATAASAQNITERIERGFYVSLSAGPAIYAINFDDGAIEDIVANTFWGVQGDAAVCRAGIGNASWLDICGGVTGFTSLGGVEQVLSAQLGGGTTETKLQTIGGFVQAKAQLGALTVGPFAGVRHMSGQKTTTNQAIGYSEMETTAFFGGGELGLRFLNERAELGLRGEYGRADGGTPTSDFTYGSGAAFLRINF